MSGQKFGYVEEVAMTKLAVDDLEKLYAALLAKRGRSSWDAFTVAGELRECREYLEQLEAS